MAGPNNEKELLIDAIQSLQELHLKSRVQDYALTTYASDSLSEVSSSTPNAYNGNDEHKRKIRELTIALEAQAMDETRRFAMASALTRKEIHTPRVSQVHGKWSEDNAAQPRCTETYLTEAATSVGRAARDIPNVDESSNYIQETTQEESKLLSINEQNINVETLGNELDKKLNAAQEAHAHFKTSSLKDKNSTVAPAETYSTELESTVGGSSKQRVSASTSSGGGKDGIISLDTKQDFEEGGTPFEAPVSPNSFFVKYRTTSPHTNKKDDVNRNPTRLNSISRNPEGKEKKDAASNEREERNNASTNKDSGALAMFKKIMVWDVSSNSSHDASEEASFTQVRLYNDTFDDELSSKYTSSFESCGEDSIKRNNRRKRDAPFKQSYVTEQKTACVESEGSVSYQSSSSHDTGTSYTSGRTVGSSFDTESQSLYTSADGSYDSLSPSSTKSSVFGKRGIPLM